MLKPILISRCMWVGKLFAVSRKFFWNSWVYRSLCQGNSGVWSLQHLPPSLDHASLSTNNMKGHAWELSSYWNVLFMHLKHVIPARRLPHPICIGYPRILFGTFVKDISFLDSEKFFWPPLSLDLMAIDCLWLAISRYMQLCLRYCRQDFRKRLALYHWKTTEDNI